MKGIRALLLAVGVLLASPAESQELPGILPLGDRPRGPFTGFLTAEDREGELVVEFQPAGIRAAVANLRKKLGRAPSRRQINIELARMLGLRTSVPIYGNTFVIKGNGVTQATLNRLGRRGFLRAVDPNFKMHAFAEPNDFLYKFGLLWGLNNTGGFFGGTPDMDVDAIEAWQITKGDPNLIVAVLDTGIALKHPDLSANIWVNPREIPDNKIDDDRNGFVDDVHGYDFAKEDSNPEDEMFHGSHCAGIIAATANNNRGIAGVAPNVKLMALRVLDEKGSGDVAGMMRAIKYAIDLKKAGVNIRIISASLGGPETVDGVGELIQEAGRNGILFVAAAGNDKNDNDVKPMYPASYDSSNVIAVAALTARGQLASFSNFGARTVDVAAPGTGIWSAFLFNFYLPFDGTSMATPFVSGAAALVMSQRPELTPEQVINVLKRSVKPLPALQGKMTTPGIVSARRALDLIQ